MRRRLAALLVVAACAAPSCSTDDDASGGSSPGATQGGGGSPQGAGGTANSAGGTANNAGGSASAGAGPVCTTCTPKGPLSYRLPSPASFALFTATAMDKLLPEAAVPEATGEQIEIFAARNELEPFQIAVRPESASAVTFTLEPLAGPGQLADVELRRVGYVETKAPSDASAIRTGRVPDPLFPAKLGAPEQVPGGETTAFWLTLRVPATAAAGDYQGAVVVDVAGASQRIPIKLHVFDFELPVTPSFDGQFNASFEALGGGDSLEAVERLKRFFLERRITPTSVAWPAGLNYNGGIEYDCDAGAFKPESGPYSFAELGPKYIDGVGFGGQGFPSFEVMQFVDNSTPRPQTFCGVDRGPTHQGTDAYNAAWSRLLAAIDGYNAARGWQKKAYYYVQNEPQGPDDYDVAAFLAHLSKTAAPGLRIAISEQPRPEIAEHPAAQGHSFDLWWADLSHFEPTYAEKRQALGEEVWWYFLYGDRPPHFNPITIDHPGIESRIGFWAAFKYRVKGFAYYSVTGWGGDPYHEPRPQGTDQNGDGFLLYPPQNGELVTSIRFELLREGAEDFEYLLRASGGAMPRTPSQGAPADTSVNSAVSSITSYTRDPSALQALRNQLGLYIEGKVDGFPVLDSKPEGAHPREATYINFQDPAGQPAAEPLVVDGKTYKKVGWDAYDPAKGYGWAGPYIGDPSIMLYRYLDDAPVSELQKSIIYNDYGRTDTFNYDIASGRYKVTVSVGWHGKGYAKHRVFVEGKPLFDSVPTTAEQPYLVSSISVDVQDGNLTLEVGQKDEYTMLNYVNIEPE